MSIIQKRPLTIANSILVVTALLFLVGGCDVVGDAMGINRCNQAADVGSTGWVEGRQGCYDARCDTFRDENGNVTNYHWTRTGPYESCN